MATYNLNRIQDPNGNIYMIDGTPNQYGTCSTGASTAAKTVTVTNSGFVLQAGARVSVKFSNANSASTPTLNVNSKGAKNIYHKGAQITTGGNKALLAGIVDFIYDGTQWHLVGNYIDTTGADGDAKTSSSQSTSKLFLVGATAQSTSGQTTYSNSSVYTTNGTLNALNFEAGSASIQSIDCQDISTQNVICSYLEIDGEDIFDIIDAHAGGSSTDTKVTQAYSTANSVYPILMTAIAGNTSTSSRGDTTAIVNNQIYGNPYEGFLRAATLDADRASLTNGLNVSDSYTVFFGDYDSMPDDVAYSSAEGYPVIQSMPSTPGIIMKESYNGTETLYQFPANGGGNTVVSTVGTVGQYIKVVASLPASPDSNTLYFIK